MPNNANQKPRLINLLKILHRNTDHEHGLTTNQLLDELENVGITTERKSLYRDIKAIKECGLSISQDGSHRWHLESRSLSKDQLIILIDSVQSTPFLTQRITENLIDSVLDLASVYQEKVLKERLDPSSYVKMENDDVLWNIDAIQRSLHAKRKLRFKYFRYNEKKEKVLQKNGNNYLENPLKLVFAEGTYYLMTYNEKYQGVTPYRVDRMIDAVVSDEPICTNEEVSTWKLENNAILSFGVFGREVKSITLECPEDYVYTIIDKFGTDIDLHHASDNLVRAYVRAPLSPQFFGWLFQLGDHIKIIHPSSVIEEYKSYLNDILNMYRTA